ncbi:MBL fold metallo-hydrolase [Stappia stellulata]|uniref:MBL fold metallo-hydrolase n=1 Tax=Stappia stellulata TaxID=71235 RepID=UPI000415E8F2|nr:MBL fold metallo-hydrolase [Stappia stellulata]
MQPTPKTLKLGQAEVTQIVDIVSETFAVGDIFPDADARLVERLMSQGVPGFAKGASPMVDLSFYGTLVRIGGQTLLIDTCCGHDKKRPARPGWHMRQEGPFLGNLASAGVTPSEVDFVMCTHLHADHVGWNTKLENGEWVPTFPNAQYIFSEIEYRHWQNEALRAEPGALLYGAYEDSVLPIINSGQALLSDPGASPCSGVHIEAAFGHTPGNMSIHVESDGQQLMLLGDVLHHRMQLADPHLNTRFCCDPQMARDTRQRLLHRVVADKALIGGGHFTGQAYGKLEPDDAGYAFVDANQALLAEGIPKSRGF